MERSCAQTNRRLAGSTDASSQNDHLAKEQLENINPDVVVIKPCGFKLDQTIRDLDVLKETVPWERWDIFHTDNIFLVDGNAYFKTSGYRI